MIDHPERTEDIVIYCTKTDCTIDSVPSGQDPYSRLAQLASKYGPDLIMLSPHAALERYEARFKTSPEEIPASRFHEMLNILPPARWRNASGGESFHISERLAGRIVSFFVRIGDRYATFSDLCTLSHEDCCRRADELFRTNPAPPMP